MKLLTIEEVDNIDNITAVYVDSCKVIREELKELGVITKDCDLIYDFESDEYAVNDDNYIVVDLKKVEEYKKGDKND